MTRPTSGDSVPGRSLRPGCHVLGLVLLNPRLSAPTLAPLFGSLRVVEDNDGERTWWVDTKAPEGAVLDVTDRSITFSLTMGSAGGNLHATGSVRW